MSRTIMPSFKDFPREGFLIGCLLAGYADLEIGLLNCVQVIRQDFDTVLKAMFRIRGETNRINIADSLGRFHYAQCGLEDHFIKAIAATRHCMKIRNQYSHCVWWSDNTGKLAFANLEEVAKSDVLVGSLKDLTAYHVDVQFLEAQEVYFVYVNDLLGWINYEGRLKSGKLSKNPISFPKEIQQPPLRVI